MSLGVKLNINSIYSQYLTELHSEFWFGWFLILQAIFDKATSHTKAVLQKTEEEKRTLEKVSVSGSFTQRSPWHLKRGYQTVLFKSVHT